jgi:hypothetical protein
VAIVSAFAPSHRRDHAHTRACVSSARDASTTSNTSAYALIHIPSLTLDDEEDEEEEDEWRECAGDDVWNWLPEYGCLGASRLGCGCDVCERLAEDAEDAESADECLQNATSTWSSRCICVRSNTHAVAWASASALCKRIVVGGHNRYVATCRSIKSKRLKQSTHANVENRT